MEHMCRSYGGHVGSYPVSVPLLIGPQTPKRETLESMYVYVECTMFNTIDSGG